MRNTKAHPGRIAIVGGGPGGLTLARLLEVRGIASTVFELDAHALARPQGGSLDLHTESGLRALAEAGLMEAFEAHARFDDQGDAIYDQHGTLHHEHVGSPDGGRPEIDRTQLRDLLLASLAPGTVRWGDKVRSIEALPGARHRIVGDAGSLGDFELVVGADGAWSKVRPLVSTAQPAYTGVTFIELDIEDVDTKHPAVAKLVPSGKTSIVGGNQALIAQRGSSHTVRVYVMFRVPADWHTTALDLSSPACARESLKAQLPDWSPSLFPLIDASTDRIVPRPLVALPIGHRWSHVPGLTLLGDAAHVMSPFSGEGVNLAMLDALELADAIATGDIAAYEAAMFTRAEAAAIGAAEGLDFVSPRGLSQVLAHFSGH